MVKLRISGDLCPLRQLYRQHMSALDLAELMGTCPRVFIYHFHIRVECARRNLQVALEEKLTT